MLDLKLRCTEDDVALGIVERFVEALESEPAFSGDDMSDVVVSFDVLNPRLYRGKLRNPSLIAEITIDSTPELRQSFYDIEDRLSNQLTELLHGQPGVRVIILFVKLPEIEEQPTIAV